jgi:hypothetical protein
MMLIKKHLMLTIWIGYKGDTTGLWDDGGFKIKRNNIERIEDE